MSSSSALNRLLNEGLLEGQHDVTTVLRPERPVRPVAVDDLEAVLAEIEQVCQVWGGAGHPLLPVDGSVYPAPYRRLLDREQFDFVGGLQSTEVELPARVETQRAVDFPAFLIAAHERREKWRTVQVCDLAADDPWRPIYAATLGLLPDVLADRLAEFHFLDPVPHDEIVPLSRVAVTGSLEDLAERLLNHEYISPRQFANMNLAYGLSPDTSYFGVDDGPIPRPHTPRRAAGPNIVVAMTPGSVEDLALLWNLRAAHGNGAALPIGIPVDQVTPAALRYVQEPGRAVMFGLGGGRIRLTSCSVDRTGLAALAEHAGCMVGDYESLLAWGPAPGRPRSHVMTWVEGRARFDPLSEGDREVLRVAMAATRRPPLTVDVTVPDAPLPTDPTMRGVTFYGRFQAGAAQVSAFSHRSNTVEVRWPSSWTSLAAVAQSRGFDVRESRPGIAARTLIEAVGSVAAVHMFAHPDLIALLYRMAEVSGMAWWKRRWASVQKELRESGVDEIEVERAAASAGRDDPVVAPAGEGRAVPFQEFVRALNGNNNAAEHWVTWAERRHLLVRGIDVKCDGCEAPTWLPMASIPPPVICAACGREIVHPYGPRDLRFTYRLGEPIRRVLETDSLGHVLALRWLAELLGEGDLIGAHPGAEFLDPSTGRSIGEADVILLMRDGSLIPVEVKRRGGGVDDANERSMDAVADALDVPWDVLAVTEPARDCLEVAARARQLPGRPRLLLTTDQLFDGHVIWAMGADPFQWDPADADADTERSRRFSETLASSEADKPRDYVVDSLLDRSLVAFRHQDGPGLEEDHATEGLQDVEVDMLGTESTDTSDPPA